MGVGGWDEGELGEEEQSEKDELLDLATSATKGASDND